MREAALYERLADARVRCDLCAHRCSIADGERGHCGVRENRGGTLYSLVYGRLVAHEVDPIEKKPLFHFLPGSSAYSVATVGCNFTCRNCQNYSISQAPRDHDGLIVGEEVSPSQVVAWARRAGCRSIAFTYTEPPVFFEYALDVSRLAREEGLKTVWVSNGYLTAEASDTLAPLLDAINIDLKGISERFYREVVGANVRPVLDTIERLVAERKLRHGGHPILNMGAAGAVIERDPAGNRKLTKDKSISRIDGLVALTMAVGSVAKVENVVATSPWDDPSFRLSA